MHQEAASTANSGNLRQIFEKANEGTASTCLNSITIGSPTTTPVPTSVFCLTDVASQVIKESIT
jgi:hypothetical protein